MCPPIVPIVAAALVAAQLSQKLLERDVAIVTLYGLRYALVVKNHPKGSSGGSRSEIGLWLLSRYVASRCRCAGVLGVWVG